MSWGIRITVLYLCFMGLIITLVVISSSNKSELVAKDYYAQELKYQERINAMANEQKLKESIRCEVQKDSVVLCLPIAGISRDFSGEVLFFRPSDSTKDRKLNLKFNAAGKFSISRSGLSKGAYKVCISWSNDHTSYYKEQVIMI